MAELNINIRVTPRLMRWGLAALCLGLMAMEVSPESITLDTYYPAPTGIYTNMVTTNNTTLARDGGNVGIGTSSPVAKLDVQGPGTGALDLLVSGKIETGGDNSGTGEVYLNPSGLMAIGQFGNNLGLMNGGGWNFQMNPNGNVSITGTLSVSDAGCIPVLYTPGGNTKICTGYVTLIGGIDTPVTETPSAEGYALCCPTP